MDDPDPAIQLDPDAHPADRPQKPSPSVSLVAENPIARQPRSDITDQQSPSAPATSQSSNSPFYTSAQWTADGTSLLVSSSLNSISTFVLPDDLLDPSASRPRRLEPQSSVSLPEPSQTIAAAPFFSLAEPSSQIALVGCRDHPIQLYHLFPPDNDGVASRAAPLASYKLIRRETEEYITPSSMLWEATGSHFLCGSANRLDYFDMTRPGSDGPLLTIPTIPSKRHMPKGGGVGMKGTVASLAASPVDANGSSIVAAGTWTRCIGLYDLHRSDKVIANWSLPRADEIDGVVGGQGIVQVRWSPCGRYLVINERHASGLLIYDIRGTGELLCTLRGRSAPTQQKMTLDVFTGDHYAESSFFEVWTGTHDGGVVVWEGVGSQVGVIEPSWDWSAHDAPVGSTALHSSGSVVATCSGGWGFGEVSDAHTVFDESSVKVWSIGG
ncbi:Guanine nucleotide-binding negative regulator 1 [Fusarium albosuccineum]|uniref:Guanine nucleotide-binding negative regulator 1 n=1 Tax=Fusarium albosuccineum TaxID=1237068 RepID=A0A8H4P7C4_9HYPO|nr:Guanine nucleotide-binding negative regulator 1 [Fusarium albosuccineum]